MELESDVFSYNAGISACGKDAISCENPEAKLEPNIACEKERVTCVREGRTVAAKLEPNFASCYNAGISACEKGREKSEEERETDAISYEAGTSTCGKGEQWQCEKGKTDAISCEKLEVKLEPTIASPLVATAGPRNPQYDSVTEAKTEPDASSYSAANRACEKSKAKPYSTSMAMWRARAEISRKWLGPSRCQPEQGEEAKPKPDVDSYNDGLGCNWEAQDTHGEWGPLPEADSKKVEKRYRQWMRGGGGHSRTLTILGSNGQPSRPLRTCFDEMILKTAGAKHKRAIAIRRV